MSLFDQNLNVFRALRPTYTRKRVGYLGRYDDSGNIDPDPQSNLPADYVWVRFSEDRSATRVKNLKVRAEWGTAVWVEYNELTREDEVREVHSILAPVQFGGAIAAALNVPGVPASVSTPVSANDVMPGRVVMVTDTPLTVRVWATWTPHGAYWDGSTLITIAPTATSSKRSFACVGITSAGASVVTLTADKALSAALIAAEGGIATEGADDIQTVMDAAPTTWWVGAILISNGDTAVDPARIYDLRFWKPPTMAGANGSVAGAVGLVPTPAAADNTKFLRGDATWATVSGGTSLPVFGAGVTKTLASDVAAAGSDRHLILAAQTSVTDDLIEITGLSAGDEAIIRADAGDTITVKHNAGGATDKIILHNATDIALSGDMTLKLVKTATGKVVQYYDEAGTGSGGITHTYVGYNTVGGSSTAMLGGTVYMKKITLASAGWLGSIAAHIDHSATTNVQNLGAWVLSDNSGTPNLQIAFGAHRGSATFYINTTARWVDIAMGVYLAAGDYWLCVQRGVDAGSDLRIFYDGSGTDKTQAVGNNWSADGSLYTISDTTNKYSIRGSILT